MLSGAASIVIVAPPLMGGRVMRGGLIAGAAGVVVAGLAWAVASSARAEVVLDRPAWLSAPTKADVAAALGSRAAGPRSGYAFLECRLERDGSLSRCQASRSSAPPFDKAALSLAPRFRAFVPPGVIAQTDPVFVDIPFRFEDTDTPGAAVELTDPEYVQSASAASAPTLLPRAASAAGVKRGLAVVECLGAEGGRPSDCAVVKEVPEGMGMGAAALDALAGRRLNLWQEAGPIVGARLRIPFFVDAPDADADPAFTRKAVFHIPDGWSGTAGPYYPERAARTRMKGSATIECASQPSGALSDCVAISDSPPGQDFLTAALRMAQSGAITAERLPSDEPGAAPRVVRVTVEFRP
jgi:hypothetical protein